MLDVHELEEQRHGTWVQVRAGAHLLLLCGRLAGPGLLLGVAGQAPWRLPGWHAAHASLPTHGAPCLPCPVPQPRHSSTSSPPSLVRHRGCNARWRLLRHPLRSDVRRACAATVLGPYWLAHQPTHRRTCAPTRPSPIRLWRALPPLLLLCAGLGRRHHHDAHLWLHHLASAPARCQ